MGKVSIGLRGWRFDEEVVFDDAGEFRPFEELPEDARRRLVRLVAIHDAFCDACWLVHGDDELEECERATVVYGEPLAEVTLCDRHEADFFYWYRERDGSELRGTDRFRDAFHEWFADGGRAPAGYGGVDHVETDPDRLPDPGRPGQTTVTVQLPEEERRRIDLKDPELLEEVFGEERAAEILARTGGEPGTPADDEDLDLDDLDLDVDYSP